VSRRWPNKVLIGLTGNITTGKSAVMDMAAERGALTLDADKIVHEILDSDAEIQEKITSAFGVEIRRSGGKINRRMLGEVVFRDPQALKRLEEIIHPKVREALVTRIDASESRVIFVEAIKLLESGLAELCDQVWVTRCPEEIQIQRLMVCRGMDEATARSRVQAQSPQSEKTARADVVIDTGGTMDVTRAYFELAWRRLSQVAESPSSRARRPRFAGGETALAGAAQGGPDLEAGSLGEILVRRARPSDVPALLLLMRQAGGGQEYLTRAGLLRQLGERGFLIGQQGTEISAVAGWISDSQIARIDQFHIRPVTAVDVTGAAVLEEIIDTARQLLCEVILAFPPVDGPPELVQLYGRYGFMPASAEMLPPGWQQAVTESQPSGSELMVRQLRDVRGAWLFEESDARN
jgi:dephospho-CoA kinase